MQRFTKLLETSRYRHDTGGQISLPDIDAYGHPLLVDAYRQLLDATDQEGQAQATVQKLATEARQLGSHDAQQMDAAKQTAADAHQAKTDAWNNLGRTIAQYREQLLTHHAARRAEAASRVRAAVDELRQAATDYIAHSAMEQAAAGQLVAQRDQIPALLALDVAFWGDGLNSPVGLEAALEALE